ncbi:MAG: excalibur calcium-binding domain-containing protein [Acidimicrobiales bacterium]|nr:excalibur calcium-binding domain-containing protein [Acidimicrobiales bacterium]
MRRVSFIFVIYFLVSACGSNVQSVITTSTDAVLEAVTTTDTPQETTIPTTTDTPQETTIPTTTDTPQETTIPTTTDTPQKTTIPTTTGQTSEEDSSTEWEAIILNQINSLSITAGTTPVSYNRDDWGSGWADQDGNCINTRHEVLMLESLEPVELSSDGCRVMSGYWYGSFSGTYTDNPSSFDIDHFVPLANAHNSGGWVWNAATKKAFYNDLVDPQHLIAVSASENRSKGARGPDEWKPSDVTYWCQYAVSWVDIKSRWGLTVTAAEQAALLLMIESCDGPPNMEGTSSPPTVTTVSTTTVPVVTTTTTESTNTPTVPPDPGNSKNCGDFSTWLEAQEWFDTYFPYYGDVGRLDGNNDGVACESLPGAP